LPWAPPPPPAKASRKGIFIGLGLGAALLLVLVAIGIAIVASRVRGGTALGELRRGDCFNTSKALVNDKAIRVDCSKAHSDEVAGVLTLPASGGVPYPGQSGIFLRSEQDCQRQATEFFGTKRPSRTTQVAVFGPNEAAWKNGDRAVVCSLREDPPVKRTGSYRDG